MSVQQAPSFLEKECRKFGFPPLVTLDGDPGPAQLSYLHLLRARKTAKSKGRILPDAVAEFQGRPFSCIYLTVVRTLLLEASFATFSCCSQIAASTRGLHSFNRGR